MTLFQVLARRPAFAATVACVLVSATCPAFAAAHKSKQPAQSAGPAGPGAQAAKGNAEEQEKAQLAEAARKAYDSGLKEYAAGRHQSAIQQLTTAVKSGVLKPSEMAKALYTRGLAYKKDNKPGQAISDLTSAIWLKNGLSPVEQKAAISERSEAYQMAGLQDTGSTPDQRAIGTPAATAAATAPAANVVANSAPGPEAGSAGLSAAAIAEAAGAQKSAAGTSATVSSTASKPVDGDSTLQSVASAPVAGSEAKPASSGLSGLFGWGQSAPAAQAPPPPPAASSGSSIAQTMTNIPGNVSGFFSNMFGGGGSQAAAPSAGQQQISVTTASTTVAAAPETSSWSSDTTVSTRAQREVVKAQKANYAPEPKPKAAALKGKFKIHIAALRSKAEAEAMAQKLVAEHGAELGNHVPVVDEAVIGSMGTFYRVRIGGYASQDEPRSLCNKFRSSGLDCLVVTN